jgi:chemotaxis protein methyltransferase CheR
MKDNGIGAASWAQLSELVAQHMGLHFPPERHGDLARGVRAAAQELGMPDTAAYVRQLLAGPLDTMLQQVLARHLTIGETYFFRDPQLLDALSRQVLPDLIQRRRGRDQRLRLWSAACASGEEAYSLAILLHRLLPDIADWRITITATDINPDALNKAATGVYGEWSFRNVPAAVKEAWFERRPDGRYEIEPTVRKLVNFEFLNLVEDVYPSLETDTNAMDVIFCRNVLMYFTPPQIARVVARLHDSLVHGGWLAVSPSETSQDLFSRFATVNFRGAIMYSKGASMAQKPVAPPLQAAKGPAAVMPTPPRQPTAAQRARALANEGKLDEALAWCDRWITADKLDPAAHYLRAVVLVEQGEREGARASLRRAVFLDPGFVLAHFALGNLARRDERSAEAARHFANVQHLLEGCQPGELVPQGEGLSVGRLAQILRAVPNAAAAP